MMKVKYSFQVKGVYPNGNKAKLSGHLVAEDGYPVAAFEEAVATCQDVTPGLIVDLSKPGGNVAQAQSQSMPADEIIEHQWIPVTKHLPANGQRVETKIHEEGHGCCYIQRRFIEGKWKDLKGEWDERPPTHWHAL